MISRVLFCLAIATLTAGVICTPANCAEIMTPYESYAPPEKLIQGAMLDLYSLNGDFREEIAVNLRNMKQKFNINTINLYGLEDLDIAGENTNKDLLFNELKRLGMKAVVRIEAYDGDAFAFQPSDLEYILDRYDELMRYISKPGVSGSIAYLALNMPVDDGRVQSRLGGVNSTLSKKRQPVYAEKFVSTIRKTLSGYGYSGAKLYLSVFYGWDNSYSVPSYIDSGADGYFINNYSYPASKVLDETADDALLINSKRLQKSVDKFKSQYGDSKVVIEYGFHTVENNKGVLPNQTAGLVKTRRAKVKALKATTGFYVNSGLNLGGFLYFGYNLYKEEGNPPAVMDWTLTYK